MNFRKENSEVIMVTPIKRISLQSEIIKYIQKYIEEHHLHEGDKLPSQGQFIEMMQVSRTALREAVKTLEAENIVEVKNGKGIYVGNGGQQSYSIQSILGFTQEKERLLEALEARRAMEKELLAMVVHSATDQEMEELGQVTERLMEKVRANLQDTAEDKEFHEMIYRMCHNQVFYAMLNLLDKYTEKFWEFPLDMDDPFKASMPYHEELYMALKERDVKKAQKINNKLLDCVYEDIVAHLKKG